MNEAALSGRIYTNTVFEGLTREQIAGILPCVAAAVESYGPRECVLDKGQLPMGPGIVLDGELVRCCETSGSADIPESIGENQLFGEVSAFSSEGAKERLVAEKPARVLYLSVAFFLSPCGKDCSNKDIHRVMSKNMLRLLSDRAQELDRKLSYLTAGGLRRKIAMYVLELYESGGGKSVLELPLNRDRLASFFSVARPSLSRELTSLKDLGVIDFYRGSVTVLDADSLRRIAHGEL